ncbi:MAG: 30S ribosomal protein S9 [Verrucomicrobiota bacterium]|nr:MAG: 30S ribosomal protein S9 [Verrucomicrobiota bacterium]
MEQIVEFLGTGRRKTAVARVRLSPGTGRISINEKEFSDYCAQDEVQKIALSPLHTASMAGKVDIRVNVFGGGVLGQAGAIRLGVARALCVMDLNFRSSLKKAGHLTRDGRKKERKKPGQPGARKRFQFSKR